MAIMLWKSAIWGEPMARVTLRARRYLLEVNRGARDSRRIWVGQLKAAGLKVVALPHLTTVVIDRPANMTWQKFKLILVSIMQSQNPKASLLLSTDRGKWFVCSNRGNRRGQFVKYP